MAALPPAGVSLQAQGFNEYIKKLDAIDEKQKEIFEAKAKETGKSFAEITRLAKQYQKELDDTAKAEKRAAQEAEKAAKKRIDATRKIAQEQRKLAEAQKTARATQQQAFISAGSVVLDFAQKIGTVTIESGKLAAQFNSQAQSVDALAAIYGQAGNDIRSAISRAAQGTLSQSQVASAALTGLQFEVATTAEQFERAASAGAVLGRGRGIGAAEGIARLFEGVGKRELELLDELGISTRNVNIEMERLAQQQFGGSAASLTQIQRETLFVEAALTVAEQKAAALGGGADKSALAFEKLSARVADLQVTFGATIGGIGAGIANLLSGAAQTAQQALAIIGAGAAGTASIISQSFERISITVGNIGRLIRGEPTVAVKDFGLIIDEASIVATDKFKEIASTIEGVDFSEPIEGAQKLKEEIKDNTEAIKAYQSAIQQAEQLQLSFSRAAEDTARKLARANEDIARKQAQQVSKLQERQTKDRDKLLKDQAKQLDKFEADRRKQIAKAESDIQKARKEAADQQKRDQQKLQRELAQAQEKFNLSQLQSERRFSLSERRLRAEGDILALQQLREDRELERQEEKENFGLSQKERVQSAEETQREQAKDLENQLAELKTNLEDQRAELLSSFDEQLKAQQEAQAAAKAEQQRAFEDAAAERAIQLAREEEDRRISQARQLEDLGRSLAEQEGVTAEGSQAIAGELEKVFGVEGVADNIMTGFATKTKSEFTKLFEDLEKIVNEAKLEPKTPSIPLRTTSGRPGGRVGGIPEFQEGGIVPGPIGSPQLIMAHAGENVQTVQQQQMTAPISTQTLNVAMSGGFNITGDGQADERILRAATQEMTENFRIAVERLGRRN